MQDANKLPVMEALVYCSWVESDSTKVVADRPCSLWGKVISLGPYQGIYGVNFETVVPNLTEITLAVPSLWVCSKIFAA